MGGVYLSLPITEKVSSDSTSETLKYGASSMQGWREAQEDAHNCLPYFDEDKEAAFFAVYDGHGGPEVALYSGIYFPDYVKNTEAYKKGDFKQALEDAFLSFDGTLTDESVVKELRSLAGYSEQSPEDAEERAALERAEAEMLVEEADMPLNELLLKYKNADEPQSTEQVKSCKKQDLIMSPAIRPKKSVADSSTDTPFFGGGDANNSNCVDSKHINGRADNDNNLNMEKELKNNLCAEQSDVCSPPSNDEGTSPVDDDDDGEPAQHAVTSTAVPDDAAAGSSSGVSSSGSGGATQEPGTSTGCASVTLLNFINPLDDDDEDDDDDDDDDEDDKEYEGDSDEEEEEEEEEDQEDDDNTACMDMTNEEPGSDSGCTACVAIVMGRTVYVANAGDSRCVLSRGGKAIELSFDHKPEDTPERSRIEKAGGKVTSDGRVNGGLNLSRALGDHFYKRNFSLTPQEQMITSLPDIIVHSLQDDDEFMILACDGIWNFMTSQEVIDMVRDKLKDPVKSEKLSIICEEMFDYCLAPNTLGDGTGCDNMTCIIVTFQSDSDGSVALSGKRCALQMDASNNCEENADKKARVQPDSVLKEVS